MVSADSNQQESATPPHVLLAKMFKDDLGVIIDPQDLCMFIRWRWDHISAVAHRIHGG